MRTGIFIAALLGVLGAVSSARAAPLPPAVLAALREAHIPVGDVGVEVREVDSKKPLISVNAAKPMNPASTMKLLTTYAGLELLGPAYTWKTEAWANGPVENGVLKGDLILKGYGDPKFTIEQFWLWLHELRGRGVLEIRGNVLADRSAFAPVPYDPGAFDNDPLRAYNVGPDALLLNFNAMRLYFLPQAGKVGVFAEPDLAGIVLDNRLTPSPAAGDCFNWNDGIHPKMQNGVLTIAGAYPMPCGEHSEYVSLLPHAMYLDAVFSALWQEEGGKLAGEIRTGTVPPGAVLLSTHQSPPLAEIIRDINKYSNNVMARQLFLTLGMDDKTPASIERSVEAIRRWLAEKKLDFRGLVLENGAGLSRRDRISAHSMALLLQSAAFSPAQAEFESSLPIVGVDGTMKKRLRESAATRHAHLKTGSLDGVKTIAGYVHSAHGKDWVMVFYINHPNAAAGQGAQNALIEWLYKH